MVNVGVAELMGRVDEHVAAEGANSVLQDAIDVAGGIRDGDTSGSKLVDLVIMRSGIYLPDMVQPYRETEEQIAESVGEIAVVVVTHEIQDRDRLDERWMPHRGIDRIFAGRITAPEPVVDVEAGTWAIPTEQYFTPYMGVTNIAGSGPMPVGDELANPSVPFLRSTLGRELSTATMTRKSGDHVPYDIPYRVFQGTAVHIGQEAIERAGLGIIQLVPNDETLASGIIGRHTPTDIFV